MASHKVCSYLGLYCIAMFVFAAGNNDPAAAPATSAPLWWRPLSILEKWLEEKD
ncbi:MAG: hypothetical protein II047_11610 [Bacteroidales bacterium]|nr:hypothetical protein [Bacteroidales bacterium]